MERCETVTENSEIKSFQVFVIITSYLINGFCLDFDRSIKVFVDAFL